MITQAINKVSICTIKMAKIIKQQFQEYIFSTKHTLSIDEAIKRAKKKWAKNRTPKKL